MASSYNWLSSKFNITWGFREGAMEQTFDVGLNQELIEGDLVILAPDGEDAGKLIKVGDTGSAESQVRPYNWYPHYKQQQDGSASPGALI